MLSPKENKYKLPLQASNTKYLRFNSVHPIKKKPMKKLILSAIVLFSFNASLFSQCDTTLFDTFTMTFEDVFEYTTPSTEIGAVYIMEVKGEYEYDCCFTKHDAAYRIMKNGFADVFQQTGWQWSGLSFRRPIPDMINPNKVYSYPFVGTGTGETFGFTDDDYLDNSGALEFTISKIENCIDTGVEPVLIYDTITSYLTVDTQFVEVINNVVIYESVTVTDTLLIEMTVGLSGTPIETEIKVFPNPANDILSVKLDEYQEADGYSVNLFNILGLSIVKEFITDEITTIDISALPIGIYTLTISDDMDQTVATKKVIIQ